MLNRTLLNRIERAEPSAKAQSKHPADCICFPEKESPFFAFEIELEMLTRVKCPLHGERFKPLYHLYVAKWLRAKQPQHLWTHHSEQYQKTWFASFPPDLWPAEEDGDPSGRIFRWLIDLAFARLYASGSPPPTRTPHIHVLRHEAVLRLVAIRSVRFHRRLQKIRDESSQWFQPQQR
jgi:hypothetical protein